LSEYREIKSIFSDPKNRIMGVQATGTWEKDPKRLAFMLARYKFVSKMLQGKQRVLEIGASDAWASRIVKQSVANLTCIDIDSDFVTYGKENVSERWPLRLLQHDMLSPLIDDIFDAVFALDVLEHIAPTDESQFMNNVLTSVTKDGVVILGMPSLETQRFSESDNGHINCKSGVEFKDMMSIYFKNVFMFCMNDEVIHTGMFEMANYLIAIGVGKKY
jgi:cyclopropane fatty-acyl-phospholipid synthase-like methyltransferase